ncbi:RagB/SusD family nutrient uptake outer membrane protein [Allomuricauda sp. SCSIO 65647]|uniref:RagB/SusD family nutrient uptake outer membrane protein n=1 Tax=Allomuricauda sp. SCSIO 65647 TaxID=2908843 RepID=UPI001F174CEC|nr:RagB/SusD family nutrient uptake outer membrane protein [Muricauda sp. SCSIO 65647]UJH67840.1 RagB/SusD family nutrient uptake outer membrane protein [Muricauda sp. SCSIO 65647]
MKKLKYTITILALVSLSLSCEDYLDEQPTVQVSEEQLFQNVSGLQVVLNGIYKFLLTESNGMNLGIAGMQIYNLTATPDLWVRNIGNAFYENSIFSSVRTESAGTFSSRFWTHYYQVINNCNIILLNVDSFAQEAPEQVAAIKGQALALRGYAYFHLIRYYQHPYSIARTAPGVPIYLDRASADRPQKDRDTVEEVYAQILADLNGALTELSGFDRPSMEYIDSDVVNGLLAKVYLTMENWAEAEQHASAARTGHPLMSAEEYTGGFDTSNAEWIWGFGQTENDNIQTTNLFSRWFFNGHRPAGTVFGDGTLRINESFVNLFDASDIRYQFRYIDVGGGPLETGWTSDKFRDDGSNYLGDMIVMRGAEMLLIEAEALAQQGSTGPALTLLNELQNARSVETPTSTMVQEDLIEAIWIEKRKELYSEGLVYWDVLRRQIDLVKLGADEGGDALDPLVIPARDNRFILQIPDDEMNFGGITVQNPLDGIFGG